MAKRLKPDQEHLWRAVVTRTWPSGYTLVEYCGPFMAKGHATNSARIATKGRSGDAVSSIVIQRSKLVWEDVETKEPT